MNYRGHIIGIVCMSILLAGCDKKPEGQVAAVVNGDEITLQEINAEIGNANIPAGTDPKEVQKAALQRIVERRLLAQSAREDGLDKTPDYLIRSRQIDDALLVQLLGQRAEKSFQVPDQPTIDKYMSENPSMFSGRKMYVVDRIQFAIPSDMAQLKTLESAHSMEAVASKLNSLGIKFGRGAAKMDSAQLGQQRLDQILALPSGEPFVIPENGMVTVAVITGESPLLGNPTEMAQMATQALRRQALTKSLEDRLKQARAKGEIKYQPEFAPKDSGKLGAGTGVK
jgi:EpsD family peptidyl-prolyl cis-trans isomerase